jgi:hypothetical protein
MPERPQDGVEQLIYDEIMSARAENRAISRHMLSEYLREKEGLPARKAFAIVDSYCDTELPSTPEYLDKEFAIPWKKTGALLLGILGSAIFAYSSLRVIEHHDKWLWGILGGLGVMGLSMGNWLKSLMEEVKLKASLKR